MKLVASSMITEDEQLEQPFFSFLIYFTGEGDYITGKGIRVCVLHTTIVMYKRDFVYVYLAFYLLTKQGTKVML